MKLKTFSFFWRVLFCRETLDPNFNLLMQEMPSVSVSVITSLMLTKSRPLIALWSVLMWADSHPGVARLWPGPAALQATPALTGGGSATCYMAIALTHDGGAVRPTKTSASTLGCRGNGDRGSSQLKLVDRLCHTLGCLEWKKGGRFTGKLGDQTPGF